MQVLLANHNLLLSAIYHKFSMSLSDVVQSEFQVAVLIGPIQFRGRDLNFAGLSQSFRKFPAFSERARSDLSGASVPGNPAGGFLFPSGSGANVKSISERDFELCGGASSPIFACSLSVLGSAARIRLISSGASIPGPPGCDSTSRCGSGADSKSISGRDI